MNLVEHIINTDEKMRCLKEEKKEGSRDDEYILNEIAICFI